MPEGLSILMPVYDEVGTVEAAIEDALSAELPVAARELVVVDDGSTDGTRELLTSRDWPDTGPRRSTSGTAARARLCAPPCRTRRSTSPRSSTPTSSTRRRTAQPLEPLVSGEAAVVFGTRAWTSQSSFSFWYVVGNKSVTFATNVLYNCWISDVMTCYKAMHTELFRSLPLKSAASRSSPRSRRACSVPASASTVPISYRARSREAGKKLTALDGLRVLRTLVRCRVL